MSRYADMISRQEAASKGAKRYKMTEPCLRGHVGERYTSTNGCIQCLERFKTPKIGPAQELFTFQVPMPFDVPTPDALRVYLVECMVAFYEQNGPRVPFDALKLVIMKGCGKPYGTGRLEDCPPGTFDKAHLQSSGVPILSPDPRDLPNAKD